MVSEDEHPNGNHELYGDGEQNWCEWCDYTEMVDDD